MAELRYCPRFIFNGRGAFGAQGKIGGHLFEPHNIEGVDRPFGTVLMPVPRLCLFRPPVFHSRVTLLLRFGLPVLGWSYRGRRA